MYHAPRCPSCGWRLQFKPGPGFFLAKCWNKNCIRGQTGVPVTPREVDA